MYDLFRLPASMEEYEKSPKGLDVKQDVAIGGYDFSVELVSLPGNAEVAMWQSICANIENEDDYGAYRHLQILQRDLLSVPDKWVGLNLVAPKTIFRGSYKREFVAYLACSERPRIVCHCLAFPFLATTFRLLKVVRQP